MRRLAARSVLACALSVPAAAGVVAVSSPAVASTGLTCTKVGGDFNSTIAIRTCAVPSAAKKAYTAASIVVSTLSSGGTFTWSKGGATTTLGPATITSAGRGRCGKYDTEQDITAPVTGGTSALTSAGDTFSADVCVYKTTSGSMSGMTRVVLGTTVSI